MYTSRYSSIDTPALLIDQTIMLQNLRHMQAKAEQYGVKLRPHTKTHKMPHIAELQVEAGARGITVAKVAEAEVMAECGLDDIFIANQVVGTSKLERIRHLHREITIRLGVDNPRQVDQLAEVFASEERPIEVLIELEVGEERSGVISDEQVVHLARHIHAQDKVRLVGIFSHEGHTYKSKDIQECVTLSLESQYRTIQAANLVRSLRIPLETVSIGATPSLMCSGVSEGVTEIRPGTYIFMDAGQANAQDSYTSCAATVLATVISTPTEERVIIDAGAKALTSQNRGLGICHTPGNGVIKGSNLIRLAGVFDEHGIIYDKEFRRHTQIGDKIEIIPNHICPTSNLYDKAYLVDDGKIILEIPILCRGKLT